MLKNLSMLKTKFYSMSLWILHNKHVFLILFHVTILQNFSYPLFPLAVGNLAPPGSRQIGDCVPPIPETLMTPTLRDSHMGKGFFQPPKVPSEPSFVQFPSSNLRVFCNLQESSGLSSHVVYLARSAVRSLVNLFCSSHLDRDDFWLISEISLSSRAAHFRQSVLKGSAFTVCRDTLFVNVPTNVEFSSRKGKLKIFAEQK